MRTSGPPAIMTAQDRTFMVVTRRGLIDCPRRSTNTISPDVAAASERATMRSDGPGGEALSAVARPSSLSSSSAIGRNDTSLAAVTPFDGPDAACRRDDPAGGPANLVPLRPGDPLSSTA